MDKLPATNTFPVITYVDQSLARWKNSASLTPSQMDALRGYYKEPTMSAHIQAMSSASPLVAGKTIFNAYSGADACGIPYKNYANSATQLDARAFTMDQTPATSYLRNASPAILEGFNAHLKARNLPAVTLIDPMGNITADGWAVLEPMWRIHSENTVRAVVANQNIQIYAYHPPTIDRRSVFAKNEVPTAIKGHGTINGVSSAKLSHPGWPTLTARNMNSGLLAGKVLAYDPVQQVTFLAPIGPRGQVDLSGLEGGIVVIASAFAYDPAKNSYLPNPKTIPESPGTPLGIASHTWQEARALGSTLMTYDFLLTSTNANEQPWRCWQKPPQPSAPHR